MLRINSIASGQPAAIYFGQGGADYYLGGEAPAYWHGKAAKQLGLQGEVLDQHFRNLMNNRTPDGSRLTQRDNPKRRAAYDFTFSGSKSLTILRAIAGDERIEQAVRNSANKTMNLAQQDARVRVRKGGQNTDRVTGNMAWIDRIHQTTRDIDGEPDPHLHLHAVAANVSWDAVEEKWKALEVGNIKAEGDYYQAMFRQELAQQIQNLGYAIRRTKNDFEIAGIPERAIKEFSRRTQQVEALNAKLASERGFDSLSPKSKAKLGATSRKSKSEGLSFEELQQRWINRLKGGEYQQIMATFQESLEHQHKPKLSNAKAIIQALERRPTTFFPQKQLLANAAYASLGESTRDGLEEELGDQVQQGEVLTLTHKNKPYVTTRSDMLTEIELLARWKKARGVCEPTAPYSGKGLDKTQQKAFDNIMTSRDRMRAFRALPGKKRDAVIAATRKALPHAVMLDRPTLNEALEATRQHPQAVIVLLDMPRRDTPRQNASDLLEDLVGTKAATLSTRSPVQEFFEGVSSRLRRIAERLRQSRVYERFRLPDRLPEQTQKPAQELRR